MTIALALRCESDADAVRDLASRLGDCRLIDFVYQRPERLSGSFGRNLNIVIVWSAAAAAVGAAAKLAALVRNRTRGAVLYRVDHTPLPRGLAALGLPELSSSHLPHQIADIIAHLPSQSQSIGHGNFAMPVSSEGRSSTNRQLMDGRLGALAGGLALLGLGGASAVLIARQLAPAPIVSPALPGVATSVPAPQTATAMPAAATTSVVVESRPRLTVTASTDAEEDSTQTAAP